MRFNFQLPAVLVACGLIAGCGDACADADLFSLDPSPVRIDLRSTNREFPSDNITKIVVPRSYIVFANNHSSRKGPLPDQFTTNHIAIRFMENGEAWNVVVDREGRSNALRSQEYDVALHPTNSNGRTLRQAGIAGSGDPRQSELYEGLIHFSGGRETYVGDASDSFESIYCNKVLHPSWFCTYQIDIGDKVSVVASFLDFRTNGGRAYANRRAQTVREIVCRFTECDSDETRRSRIAARPFIGDQKRNVCITRDIPQKIVAMGLETNVRSTFPSSVTQQIFWRLRVPAHFHVADAWPRKDASRTLSGAVLYPEMVPAAPIVDELWRAWLTVPASDDRPVYVNVPRDTPCLAYAELSLEDVAQRTIDITLRPPVDYPETSTVTPAAAALVPHCGTSSSTMAAHVCILNVARDGWPVQLSFQSKWQSRADSILDRVNSYLDQITLSRDSVAVAETPLTPK